MKRKKVEVVEKRGDYELHHPIGTDVYAIVVKLEGGTSMPILVDDDESKVKERWDKIKFRDEAKGHKRSSGECGYIFKNETGLEVTSDVDYGERCVINYFDKDLAENLEYIVDCEGQCDRWGFDDIDYDYDQCVKDCKDTVNKVSIGSIEFSKRDNGLIKSSIPLDCRKVFPDEDIIVMSGDDPEDAIAKVQGELQKKLQSIGCQPFNERELGWMHPHEFTESEEIEEFPAMCWLHIRRGDGNCKFKDLLELLRNET